MVLSRLNEQAYDDDTKKKQTNRSTNAMHKSTYNSSSEPLGVPAFSLIMGRHSLSGSMIGGIPETQEMLDFCGAHNITADVEIIPIQKVNEAYERLLKSDVKYRFSIDMASLKSE
jgi:D-arabinose 1-dehydrogenase-like Zn-dependent alcohol dehydrogenase